MTKTKANDSNSTLPSKMYYADQPAAMAIGHTVCRLTFGVHGDDDGPYPQPVVSVVMPTASWIRLANDLVNTFNSAEFKKDALNALKDAVAEITSGGRGTPDSKLVRVTPRKKGKALDS